MPRISRRTLLATVSTGTVGALAGCSTFSALTSGTTQPVYPTLADQTVFVDSDVSVPETEAITTIDDPAAADIAVYPARDAAVEHVTSALDADTIAAVVGRDAQHTVMQGCAADGRAYGFASDGWGPDTQIVAAAPSDTHLVTHVFEGTTSPDDVPWALEEVLSPAGGDCPTSFESTDVPSDVEADTVPLGASRLRGRNDVAGFDRWDRVRTTSETDRRTFVLDTAATILSGSADAGADRYNADQVRIAAEFDHRLDDVGPAERSTDHLDIVDTGVPVDDAAERRVTATSSSARQSFTACLRCLVTASESPVPFSYLANARFRWRDPRLLEDDLWHHHTPGQAVWYPSQSP